MPPARSPEVHVLNQQVATLRKGVTVNYQQTDITLKVAIMGPSNTGKTKLANQIAAVPTLSELVNDHVYSATCGVRILPFSAQLVARPLSENNKASSSSSVYPVQVGIELWDCGGSTEHESCWPAICSDLHAVVLVYDPSNKTQSTEIKTWAEWFTTQAQLKEGQIIAFAHSTTSNSTQQAPKVIKITTKPTNENEKPISMTIPVVTVTSHAKESNSDGSACSARVELEQFLGGVFAHHPKADFSTLTP